MRFSGNLLQFTCLVHVIFRLTAFDENEGNMNYDEDYFADVSKEGLMIAGFSIQKTFDLTVIYTVKYPKRWLINSHS